MESAMWHSFTIIYTCLCIPTNHYLGCQRNGPFMSPSTVLYLKWRKFTGVCLPMGAGRVSRSLDRSHGRVPPPADMGHELLSPPPPHLDMGPRYPIPYYWHLVAIIGDLFKLVHLRTYPCRYWHLVVATEIIQLSSGRYTSYWNTVLLHM